MNTLVVIFVLLLSPAIVRAQDSSRSILQTAAAALSSHESVSYLAQYGYRTSLEDDTVKGSGAGKKRTCSPRIFLRRKALACCGRFADEGKRFQAGN